MLKLLTTLSISAVLSTSVFALSDSNECFESSDKDINEVADEETIKLIDSVCVSSA